MAKSKEIKTIEVAGKTYAVGLFWQPVQEEKNYLKEIKATVQTVVTNANLYCLKKGAATQYGLGSTVLGHKSGMPSGASGVANALRDKSSAICVFKLKEGWWFITIRNNLILSEEDTIYTDENDAKEAFESMLSIPDWGYKIAPAEWGIDETTEMSAEDLLGRGQSIELKKIDNNIKKNLLIFLILAFVSWQYYQKRQEQIELQRKLLEKKRLEEMKKLMPPPPPPPPPPAPWESLVSPEDFAKKCTVLIVNSTGTVPGWNLEDSTCKEKQISSVWKRTYGTAGWIFEAQKFGTLSKDIKLSASDSRYDTVVGLLDIPSMKHEYSKPTLQKIEIQKKLNGIFHSLKISGLKLENKSTVVKDPKNPSYSENYPYTSFKFTDVAYRLPLSWVKLLKDVGGVEIDSISWNAKKKTWDYAGKIYELTPAQIKKDEDALKKAEEEKNKPAENNQAVSPAVTQEQATVTGTGTPNASANADKSANDANTGVNTTTNTNNETNQVNATQN
ncbi:MAG: type 4b pilus protein PilO2 [Alphaproteobacteria bacterium]|nr:type 4b pilus protein PilO2 [Alphaproteobacteria bacterium]